jgi:hypothetical protein
MESGAPKLGRGEFPAVDPPLASLSGTHAISCEQLLASATHTPGVDPFTNYRIAVLETKRVRAVLCKNIALMRR